MKKIIITLFTMILILAFSGCSNDTPSIKSVSINDKTYYPIYLYSYSNAKLLDADVVFPSKTEQLFQTFAKSGYFLSRNEYRVGESIDVDFSCFYGEDGLKLSYEDRENYAYKKVNINITEVEKRKISVKEKGDTFVISYSEIDSIAYDVKNNDSYGVRKYCSLSQNKDLLNELVIANEIETVKENVVISYDTQSLE